jgi:hypothetical protein
MTADAYATTLGQQSVWFADQALGVTSAYHVTVTVSIDGFVSRSSIDQACERLADSTPALRVRIGIDDNGDVVQWFSAELLPIEWLAVPEGCDDKTVQRVIREGVSRPFDVDGGALVRFVAVRADDQRTVLVIVGHHTVMDGVTQGIVADRFVECLSGPVAPQPPERYLDLVRQVVRAETQAAVTDIPYWLSRLVDGLQTGDWATEGGAVGSGGNTRTPLPADRLEEYRRVAADLHVSLFTVVLGVVHHVLGTFGVTTSVVCSAASVRPRDGSHDRTAGCFVNQVPLIARHEPGETAMDLVARQSPQWREDIRRRYLPLITIRDALSARSGVPVRLDHAFASFRSPQATKGWQVGPLSVTAEIFNRYYEPKADLSVRFMWQAATLEYDIEWSPDAPRGLGADFAAALRSRFGSASV